MFLYLRYHVDSSQDCVDQIISASLTRTPTGAFPKGRLTPLWPLFSVELKVACRHLSRHITDKKKFLVLEKWLPAT